MALNPAEEFIMAAFAIRQAQPDQWTRFLAGLARYRDQTVEHCIMSTLDELPRTQGRAQAMTAIYTLLSTAHEKAPAIQQRESMSHGNR